jgi:DNA-binding NarL/FixJ family response regulator
MCAGGPRGDPGVMGMRCMIIDDNISFLHALRSMLERDGVSVVSAALNGSDGLDRAFSSRPDVLLIDVRLGSENGFEVAQRMKERAAVTPGWRPVIILLSTHTEYELADRMALNPSFGFLEKTTVSTARVKEMISRLNGHVVEVDGPSSR